MIPHSDLFELIGAASPISQVVLIILLGFSVVSWAIIFYKWRLFRTIRKEDRRFLNVYEALDDPKEVRRRSAAMTKSPMAELFTETYRTIFHDDGIAPGWTEGGARRLERGLRQISDRQLLYEEEYLSALATVGNVSPFIGLFGTVFGIIQAFQEIGRQGSASIAAVAPGVAEALVATAAGLLAAIPAVVAYNYFLNQIRRHSTQMDVFRQDLLGLIEHRAPVHSAPVAGPRL